MPLQNRATPLGGVVAHPARGLVYGNRGCLHDDAGRIRRRYAGRRWISCRLAYRDWRRGKLLQPGRYTELFFLDEATALAAGHRACALCRREDYNRLLEILDEAGADSVDARLHGERLDPETRGQRLHEAPFAELPEGAFVLWEGAPHVVLDAGLRRWTAAGYGELRPRPGGEAVLVTPPSLVEALRAGWQPVVPFLHPSARVQGRFSAA